MGKVTGFLEFDREAPARRPVPERLNDYREVYESFAEERLARQCARCMDCGVPFCNTGCPLNNLIPDFNDLLYRERWPEALRALHATNNFPEFTGRVCPAPCEAACVLAINQAPVTIKLIEQAAALRHSGFQAGEAPGGPPAGTTRRRRREVSDRRAGWRQRARRGIAPGL
jgi:glutamate synthase (NADPH/NADH) small chain